VIQEMEEKMITIRPRIKEAQDEQKSYADAHQSTIVTSSAIKSSSGLNRIRV
jgi:hypothetical protein